MIDLDSYRRAIQWLERGVSEYSLNPETSTLRDSVMLSFEVTYNLTETTLRKLLAETTVDPEARYLSSRELMRYAEDEGLFLASPLKWLGYGASIEQVNATQGDAFAEVLAPVLAEYLKALKDFADGLNKRLVPIA